MSKTHISEQIERGSVILERLGKASVPAALKPYVATFKSAYGAFEKARSVAEAARKKRDLALEEVGDEDERLDPDIESLATEMVGAKMGKRANPFVGFSRYAPSKLVRLPYATEADEVQKLVTAIGEAEPGPAAKAAGKCKKGAEAVLSALGNLTHPQAQYATALADRDALLPACTKALRKLKTQAKAAWDEAPGVYDAIFAPPERVQAPKTGRSRARKKAPPPGPTAPK